MDLYTQREVLRYNSNKPQQLILDYVVSEVPLTLFLNHLELITMICSPANFVELGLGFLFSEGFIRDFTEIISVNCQEETGILHVETNSPPVQINGFMRRHMASCCGRGRAGLYFINDARQLEPIISEANIIPGQILNYMNRLEHASNVFRDTGGVHSAAVAGEQLFFVFEDIGRHNAVDKVIGHCLINKLKNDDKCLVLSGRIASEIVIKAIRAGIPIIISRAAPTELALDIAEEYNVTLVGFARNERFTVFTHPERIQGLSK